MMATKFPPKTFPPRVRVKAVTRMLGGGVPDDAQPGDLVVGNRGAAAIVIQPPSQWGGLAGCIILQYAGNFYESARIADGRRRIYDFRGGT